MKWLGEVSGGTWLATVEEDVMVWPRGLTMSKHPIICACPDLSSIVEYSEMVWIMQPDVYWFFLLFHQMQEL